MSSISSVGNGVDLFQVLQQATGADTTSSATLATQIADQTPSTDETQQTEEAGHHHKGHHGLHSKIESAVTTALQSADPSEDPNKVVQDAIASVLKGTDGTDTGQSGSAVPGGQTGAAGAAGGAGSTSQSDFAQLLQANGISASQFQSDLKAAWTDGSTDGSGGGGLDFSKLFQSFPPGSAIDTTA